MSKAELLEKFDVLTNSFDKMFKQIAIIRSDVTIIKELTTVLDANGTVRIIIYIYYDYYYYLVFL